MKTVVVIAALILLLPGVSCKKVINVDIHNASPQIVIVGEVTNAPGPYQVSITQTVNFNDSNIFPPVSGAAVIISDGIGVRDSLTEISPGLYQSHPYWQGNSGNTYTLYVNTGKNTYMAYSTMPVQVPLDSVGFFYDNNRGGNTIIEAIPYFQDPPGVRNFYQFTEAVNGHPLNKIFIFSDQFSDGRYIREPLFDDSTHSHMQSNDQLDLSMYCIDSTIYSYFNSLQQISGTGGFQSVTPANPNSNLSGGALGYFSAHTIQTKSQLVP
ncbi:MAG TPA: DUF4249 domain-containing protein [Puia sp.]|nr:DUF4249 domain-containing protein [Puia sp.]